MTIAKTTTIEGVVAKTALFGVAGWALENALFKERYSALFVTAILLGSYLQFGKIA
jgi:hypothetical protein